MIRRPPRSTRTDTLFPYTTLFRSVDRFRLFRVSAPNGENQRSSASNWTVPPAAPVTHRPSRTMLDSGVHPPATPSHRGGSHILTGSREEGREGRGLGKRVVGRFRCRGGLFILKKKQEQKTGT